MNELQCFITFQHLKFTQNSLRFLHFFYMNLVVENHQCPLHCNWLRHGNDQKVAIMQNMGSVLKTKRSAIFLSIKI